MFFHIYIRCIKKRCFFDLFFHFVGQKYGKNMLDHCLFPRRMRSALQWSRPETNVSMQPTCRHTVTFAATVCYTEVLFRSSFSLCRSTRCLRNLRLPTRWLGSGLRNGAHRASHNVTVHRLSAYSQDLLFTAHLHDSRLYQAKGAKTCCAHHPRIDRPILCCLLSQYTHNPSWSTLGLHIAHGSGAYGCSTWIHGSTSSRPLMSCVQGWSVSMTSDIKTCTLGKPKSYTDKAAEWTTLQQE